MWEDIFELTGSELALVFGCYNLKFTQSYTHMILYCAYAKINRQVKELHETMGSPNTWCIQKVGLESLENILFAMVDGELVNPGNLTKEQIKRLCPTCRDFGREQLLENFNSRV